jgi:uncharacterized iron-regulated membrane protein
MEKTKKNTIKKLLGQLHLWGGLVSGIIVFVVAVTGCLYVFEAEIRDFTQKEYRFVKPQSIEKASLASISKVVSAEFPSKQIEQVRVYSEASRATIVKLIDKKKPFDDTKNKLQKEEKEPQKEAYGFNPYTGQLLGKDDLEHDFMHTVEEIHTSLLLGEVGKWLIKANVLIFLVMLLSGLYLWWPRKKNQRKMAFNLNLKGKFQAINYSLHNTLGFYFLLPLMLISLTGIWWAVKPVQKVTYAALGQKMKDKEKVYSTFIEGKNYSPDAALGSVAQKYAGWNEAHINFAKTAKEVIKINLKYPYQTYKKSNTFEFDKYSGEVLKSELFRDYQTADKIKHANRDLHTGQNYGLLGKFLAFFASFFAATLPLTGFMIWYQRKYKKTVKKERLVSESSNMNNPKPKPISKPQMLVDN